MSIDDSVVKKIANLSKISLTEEEQKLFKVELNNILEWVDELQKVNTDKVEPMLSVFNESMKLRQDKSEQTNADDILNNAPEKKEGFFIVPKVIE